MWMVRHLESGWVGFITRNHVVMGEYRICLFYLNLGLHNLKAWEYILNSELQVVVGRRKLWLLVDILHGRSTSLCLKLKTFLHQCLSSSTRFPIHEQCRVRLLVFCCLSFSPRSEAKLVCFCRSCWIMRRCVPTPTDAFLRLLARLVYPAILVSQIIYVTPTVETNTEIHTFGVANPVYSFDIALVVMLHLFHILPNLLGQSYLWCPLRSVHRPLLTPRSTNAVTCSTSSPLNLTLNSLWCFQIVIVLLF